MLRASESESLRDMIANSESSLAPTHPDERGDEALAAAAIIAVPTPITGWFGMNIPYWGLDPVGCTGLMLVSMITLFVSFRSRD